MTCWKSPISSLGGDPDPARTRLGVPLLRDGVPIGVFRVDAAGGAPFHRPPDRIGPDFCGAGSHRDRECAAVQRDQGGARSEQTATADILKVIASSPDDCSRCSRRSSSSANRLIDGFSAACTGLSTIWCTCCAYVSHAAAGRRTQSSFPVAADAARFGWRAPASGGGHRHRGLAEWPVEKRRAGARFAARVCAAEEFGRFHRRNRGSRRATAHSRTTSTCSRLLPTRP